MQSYVSLDALSMTPYTPNGLEMGFGSNSSVDVDLRSSQSALGSDIYPGFQAQDMVSENLGWLHQDNIVSQDFRTDQNDLHPNGLLNGRFTQLDSAMHRLLRAENHIINPIMGRRFNQILHVYFNIPH
ncbi:hypothetical protein BDV34DRAFT_219266 [Aspergillus parasiticus]|uniref:Uncharacterized protein n=1 Tax=Aspergillus parasiticus TaxID=5067 RepID=A0A5N6E5J8_ASPPA|nr:hypothetical protein BDV34DRAFT_219266 [Aspergillus parasiticus]